MLGKKKWSRLFKPFEETNVKFSCKNMKIRKGIRDCIHKQEIRFSTKISKTSVEARPQPTDSWRLQQGVAVGTAGPQVGGQEPGMLPA